MKHNLETIKLKIRAYNTERGSLQDIFDECRDFEKELRGDVVPILSSKEVSDYLESEDDKTDIFIYGVTHGKNLVRKEILNEAEE